MANILVIGSHDYSDLRTIKRALRRVEQVYRGPYTLLHTTGTTLSSLVAGASKEQGWDAQPIQIDPECAPTCKDHRRKGGSVGTFCPTARRRRVDELIAGWPIDLVLCFTRPETRMHGTRLGQESARARGLALWEYEYAPTAQNTAVK